MCRHCGMSALPSLLGRSNTYVGSSGNWVDRSGTCFAVEPMTGPRCGESCFGGPGNNGKGGAWSTRFRLLSWAIGPHASGRPGADFSAILSLQVEMLFQLSAERIGRMDLAGKSKLAAHQLGNRSLSRSQIEAGVLL